jgi:hypothetical protein
MWKSMWKRSISRTSPARDLIALITRAVLRLSRRRATALVVVQLQQAEAELGVATTSAAGR